MKSHMKTASDRLVRHSRGVLVLMSLALLMSTPAEAKQRIEFLNNGRGVRDLTVTTKERAERRASIVQVQGTVSYQSRSGLRLDKYVLQISSSTAVYPTLPGVSAALDPSRMSGRRVTVFGRRYGNTIDAQLVIVSPREDELPRLESDSLAEGQWIEPSEAGTATGRFRAGTPE